MWVKEAKKNAENRLRLYLQDLRMYTSMYAWLFWTSAADV